MRKHQFCVQLGYGMRQKLTLLGRLERQEKLRLATEAGVKACIAAVKIAEEVGTRIGASAVDGDDAIAKVSIVGLGMRDHAGVASKMFTTLSGEGINIQMINTSEIKISVVIDEKYTELACRSLHDAFELGAGPATPEEF